jgi:hypothetical protein
MLCERLIGRIAGFEIQSLVTHVSYDADDRHPLRDVLRADLEAPAERVLTRPETARHVFVDDAWPYTAIERAKELRDVAVKAKAA